MDTHTQNVWMREEKSREVSEHQDWSKLCSDLLRPILQSLSSLDFHRAKTVCSDWFSVWKTCVKRPLCPWQIMYNDKNYSKLALYNPGEDKVYTAKFVGLSEDSYYMASYGNWLLMVNSRLEFYIFNLLTCKRINLPLIEHCRNDIVWKDIVLGIKGSAVLWIDERTGDYVVAWIFKTQDLFSYKKGDDAWWNWNKDRNIKGFLSLAYKNSKLYLYTTNGRIKIFDFSGDNPKEEIVRNPYFDHPFYYNQLGYENTGRKRIAIQKSGEVLIITSLGTTVYGHLFYIFKMNHESKKWERVDSIGDDEMLIFGHGVTLKAPVQDDVGDGIKGNVIWFDENDIRLHSSCASVYGVFDLTTSITKWTKNFGYSIQWFVPGFA